MQNEVDESPREQIGKITTWFLLEDFGVGFTKNQKKKECKAPNPYNNQSTMTQFLEEKTPMSQSKLDGIDYNPHSYLFFIVTQLSSFTLDLLYLTKLT